MQGETCAYDFGIQLIKDSYKLPHYSDDRKYHIRKAIESFKRSSHTNSWYELYLIKEGVHGHWRGGDVDIDRNESRKYLRKAVDLADHRAITAYASHCRYDEFDASKAVKLYEKSITLGCKTAYEIIHKLDRHIEDNFGLGYDDYSHFILDEKARRYKEFAEAMLKKDAAEKSTRVMWHHIMLPWFLWFRIIVRSRKHDDVSYIFSNYVAAHVEKVLDTIEEVAPGFPSSMSGDA